jgi:hypothetical protein
MKYAKFDIWTFRYVLFTALSCLFIFIFITYIVDEQRREQYKNELLRVETAAFQLGKDVAETEFNRDYLDSFEWAIKDFIGYVDIAKGTVILNDFYRRKRNIMLKESNRELREIIRR